MTNPYKLTDNVSSDFQFEIGDFKYTMKYPTGLQRKAMSEAGVAANKAANKAEAAQKAGNDEEMDKYLKEAEKHANEFSKLINGLITAGEGAPKVDDALEKQPNPVLWNFQRMLEAELSVTAPAPRR